jgi:2-polyprenyl-3-methyl-5-hydroxy-6-metoxy-1,4-benzoquinol methylase
VKCRHCGQCLELSFLDLGTAPPSNAYLNSAQLAQPELYFPLRLLACENCHLVQTEDFAQREALFTEDYAYFSSFSSTWLTHARLYVAQMCKRFALNTQSMVLEVAANDGYLLQYVQQAGIPCYGIEPTVSTATAAKALGLTILDRFFGRTLAQELATQGKQADLIAANNVLAHVPDINDFVAGFALLLKPGGVATFEFPHLLSMVRLGQFDTAYHEHYSYLSLHAVQRIFATNGLQVFDVENLATHGGSLRVYAQTSDTHALSERVTVCLDNERKAGMLEAGFYRGFQARAEKIKNDFLAYLIHCRQEGLSVAAYGAAAKGNTLLNFAGIKSDLLAYVVDRNPQKQHKFLPSSRIPIVNEAHLQQHRPDRIVILPWNLSEEIQAQLAYVRDWGARFVLCVPQLDII